MQEVELQSVEMSEGSGEALVERRLDYLSDVEVEVEARIGTMQVSVGELFSMKEGKVIALMQKADEPVDLLLKGRVVARGRLTVVGDSFGVEVTEVS